jgi:hypothetical protein
MSISYAKPFRLLSVLANNPVEFLDRSLMIAGVKFAALYDRKSSYELVDWDSLVFRLNEILGPQFRSALSESQLASLTSWLSAKQLTLPPDAPFGVFHNGDRILAQLCYAVVRARRPRHILETGVCYGVTSAHLLAALDANAEGHLSSIDLPPLGERNYDYVGWLAPPDLRGRWSLHRGTSRKLLRPLLKGLGSVDLFVHDSLHTYKNMKMEFESLWPYLSPGGVLISDDIEGNSAFQEFVSRPDVLFHAAIQEQDKHSIAGVLVKAGQRE